MKILSTKEIQDRKQAEISRDISRTQEIKKTLDKSVSDLNEVDARFNLALANQRVRWAKEEEEALKVIKTLREEIEALELKKKETLIPLEDREKKSYALFTEAEKVLAEAQSKFHEAEQLKEENEITADLLQEKLDGVYETETSLGEREKKLFVREKAVEEERALIKDLSSELSIKLTNLK